MAYNKKELFESSKKLIVEKNLIFTEDIIASLGIGKSTFYEFYPATSDEMETLKRLLNENRIRIKTNLRKKWLEGENATLQMALYKLTSTPEEHKLLQQNYTEQNTKFEIKPTKYEVVTKENLM